MRKIPFVDLKAGFEPIKAEVMAALEDVFAGMNLNLGPNVRLLEQEFAAYCGTKYAVGVGSGTDAIAIALMAAGIESGDEVITTPHTFFATAEAIAWAGAAPVFVDIDQTTYNIDPSLIEKKITKKTKAIVPVHMYGQSAEIKQILDIAGKHGLKVIEDACQAHGAEYIFQNNPLTPPFTKGGKRGFVSKRCGSIGDAGCFSFYFTKNLGGYGEGGIITTDDPDIAEKTRLFRNHGHVSKYEHSVMGYNSRLDEIQAAILRVKIKRLEEYTNSRRAVAAGYNELLCNTPLILPDEASGRKHVYHLYVVRSKERDKLMQHLADAGIGTGIHYKNPVHLQEACKAYGCKKGDLPVTEKICEEILSLPIYPELQENDILYIAEKIKEFYNT